MKYITACLIAILSFVGGAIGSVITDGFVVRGIVGYGQGVMRHEAGLVVNNATGKAFINVEDATSPGNNQTEAAIGFFAFDEGNSPKQRASISAMWGNNASTSNGRGVLRFNVDGADESSRVDMIMHGRDSGIDLFCHDTYPSCEQNSPGGPYLRLNRTSGLPSVIGRSDLVLWGNASGNGSVFLNNTGDTVIGNGGGLLRFGAPMTSGTKTNVGFIPVKTSTGQVVYIAAYQ